MPNMRKQPGDAILSRDGTVKVNGVSVGVWWRGYWEEADVHFYHFALARDKEPLVTEQFRHRFKARIPEHLKA